MQGVSWEGAIPSFFLGAFAVFLAATAWYWYTYFAPRLWPAVDIPADPVAIPAYPGRDDMPAFADTVTPKAATPVTLPALWEPEAHNEVVEDVSENGTTPQLRSAAGASFQDPYDLRFDDATSEDDKDVLPLKVGSALEEQERALQALEAGLQDDLRRADRKEAVFSQRALDICKEDFAD